MKEKKQKPNKKDTISPKKKISGEKDTEQKTEFGGLPDIDLKKNLGCG